MLCETLHACSSIPDVSMYSILKFIRFAQLARPSLEHETSQADFPPVCLPFRVALILARAISVDLDIVRQYWEALKNDIWRMPVKNVSLANEAEVVEFNEHALPIGTCELILVSQHRLLSTYGYMQHTGTCSLLLALVNSAD